MKIESRHDFDSPFAPSAHRPDVLTRTWDLLVFTDREIPRYDASRTLFVCFDTESAQCLRDLGCRVKQPCDYSIPLFASYEDLFEHYAPDLAIETSPFRAGDYEDCAYVIQNLRNKAPEVFAPIQYAWDIAMIVIAEEQPIRIEIDIGSPWLAIVLGEWLKARKSAEGCPRV